MKTKIVSIMAAWFCAISFCAKPAEATLITIEIEAVVDYVGDPYNYLEGKIKVGDIISGFYTYGSSSPDTNPSPSVGDYEHFLSPSGIFLTVGGLDFASDPGNVVFLIEIINDSISGGLHDSYIVRSYSNLPLSNGVTVDHISWILSDSAASALSSDGLPLYAPVLNDWQSIFGLRISADRMWGIEATVTSAELIPEPATALLLSLGGMLLVRTSLRKK